MENTTAPAASGKLRGWRRDARPLAWWFILVLVLFAIRKHQEWSAKTNLKFTVHLEQRFVSDEVSATIDGRLPIFSGSRVPLGSHTFTISHSKGVPFSTNFFIWYGEHNLGDIVLKRATGTLEIKANPPAPLLVIRGPEFNIRLTNSAGMTSSVPTDRYYVEVKYPRWERNDNVSVLMDSTGYASFLPQFGAVQLGCNQGEATFQLFTSDERLMEAGKFPSTLEDIPAGFYKVVAYHHDHRLEKKLSFTAGKTNEVQIEFIYGAAAFETEPSGASVFTSDGRNWGETPLTLSELTPGSWEFTLRKYGHESLTVSLEIAANQTNTLHTNLVNMSYASAIESARRNLASGEFERALEASEEALRISPNDKVGTILQRESRGRGHLRRAQMLGKENNYADAVAELESALNDLPENVEAKELIVDFKKRAAVQAEERKAQRSARPRQEFEAVLKNHPGSEFFETFELKSNKRAKDLANAISNGLKGRMPFFKVPLFKEKHPEIFLIEGIHDFIGGNRQCVVVVGQTTDEEAQIIFKVLEYKPKHNVTMTGLLNFLDNVQLIPVNAQKMEMTEKLQNQVKDGIRIVTERIQNAINDAPTVSAGGK